MTALPDQTLFDEYRPAFSAAPTMVRPHVEEHYWGYTISPNLRIIDLAVLLRGAAGVLMIGSFLAAIGVWVMPASLFLGEALILKSMASILLSCLGAILMSFVGRGTTVRAQINTANGEIVEAVDGILHNEVVLARYGFDVVMRVDVVASREEPNFGQVQLVMSDGRKVAAGDGSLPALGGLRDRLACDLGLEPRHPRTEAVWAGPIAA